MTYPWVIAPLRTVIGRWLLLLKGFLVRASFLSVPVPAGIGIEGTFLSMMLRKSLGSSVPPRYCEIWGSG
jgi:hypothetical protein